MLQLDVVKHVRIGPKRLGDKKLPVEFISEYGTIIMGGCKIIINPKSFLLSSKASCLISATAGSPGLFEFTVNG